MEVYSPAIMNATGIGQDPHIWMIARTVPKSTMAKSQRGWFRIGRAWLTSRLVRLRGSMISRLVTVMKQL